jgi:hypothetical protein
MCLQISVKPSSIQFYKDMFSINFYENPFSIQFYENPFSIKFYDNPFSIQFPFSRSRVTRKKTGRQTDIMMPSDVHFFANPRYNVYVRQSTKLEKGAEDKT